MMKMIQRSIEKKPQCIDRINQTEETSEDADIEALTEAVENLISALNNATHEINWLQCQIEELRSEMKRVINPLNMQYDCLRKSCFDTLENITNVANVQNRESERALVRKLKLDSRVYEQTIVELQATIDTYQSQPMINSRPLSIEPPIDASVYSSRMFVASPAGGHALPFYKANAPLYCQTTQEIKLTK